MCIGCVIVLHHVIVWHHAIDIHHPTVGATSGLTLRVRLLGRNEKKKKIT